MTVDDEKEGISTVTDNGQIMIVFGLWIPLDPPPLINCASYCYDYLRLSCPSIYIDSRLEVLGTREDKG